MRAEAGRGAAEREPAKDLLVLARRVGCAAAITRAGRIQWANDACAELLEVADPRELSGTSIDSLLDDAPDARPASRAPGTVVSFLRRATDRLEVEIVRVPEPASGKGCDADEELWVIRDVESKRTLGAELHAFSDALRDAHAGLALAREQLATELLEREQLLSVVSHELRTPITVILGYNNLLLSDQVGVLNEEQRSFLRESNSSCKRLNRFVGDLLAACGEAGNRLTLELKRNSIEPIVLGLVSFFRPLLDDRELELELDLAPDALHAVCDPVRVEQVLTNLLSNAMRYSRPNTAVAVTSRRAVCDGTEILEVSVVDTGPGVAVENRERIFEPYVRAGADRNDGGLGLGLAICKRIIDAHGGTIRVEEGPAGGSRFSFTLPSQAITEVD